MSEPKHQKIAIVDDDYAVRDSLRVLLEVMGYLVEAFESAAAYLNADRQNLACLILDHQMPHMTGLQLVEKLRADGAATPILLITGSPSPAIYARAAELGIEVLDKAPGDEGLLDFVGCHAVPSQSSAIASRSIPI
jgi:two-component system, LuxR family, response regulator FixJ